MLVFAPDLSIYYKNSQIEKLVLYNLNFEWHGSLIPDLLHAFIQTLAFILNIHQLKNIELFYTI